MGFLDAAGPPVRRHSLLKRNPALDRAAFSDHYEHRHGPLASRQPGFRRYTRRYVQNHVETLPDGAEPLFDGCTQTTQVVRDDYATGFFDDPDYANVEADERFLFDIAGTVSMLGTEHVLADGATTRWKALLLTTAADFDPGAFAGAVRVVLNRLDPSTASALGFGGTCFSRDGLAELWFKSEAARQAMLRRPPPGAAGGGVPVMLPVREVVMFGPERPWRDDRGGRTADAGVRPG